VLANLQLRPKAGLVQSSSVEKPLTVKSLNLIVFSPLYLIKLSEVSAKIALKFMLPLESFKAEFSLELVSSLRRRIKTQIASFLPKLKRFIRDPKKPFFDVLFKKVHSH